MRSLVRFLGILFAIISVGVLGYYAYILGVETLTYPFLGSDVQKGNTLDVIVARPRFPLRIIKGPILDEDALRESIHFVSPLAKETSVNKKVFSLVVSGEHIELSSSGGLGEGESFIVDANAYNANKTTRYRLPRDMILSFFEHQKALTVEKIGLPRESTYHVSMNGFDMYTPENIRYFISYHPDVSCSGMTSLEGYTPIFPKEIAPMTREGQRMDMTIRFDIDHEKPYVCLMGGVNGTYTLLEDRALDPFMIEASNLETLSPEYDMQSRIVFQFSHPIYEDTGTLYSPEFIAHRRDAKLWFLKHLSISPDIPLNSENLILTPDRAILTLPLKEGVPTDFLLDDIPDIYGRMRNLKYSLTPERSPFLSLRFYEPRTYYHPGESIRGKLYALKSPKKSYTLKLCQISLETYSHMERITSEDMTGASLDAVYSVMSGSDTIGCIKKDIDLTMTGYASSFDVQDFVTGRRLSRGFYIITFMNTDDIQGFQKPVQPLLFSIIDSHISMKVNASGKMLFLVTDNSTGKPLENQEITLRRNITRMYSEIWNSKTNQTDRTYVSSTAPVFSTGILLGKTNVDGFLEVTLDALKGTTYSDVPYSVSFEGRGDYEGRYESFLVESRGVNRFGLLVSTWNDAVTGYDFGIQEKKYSSESRPRYTAYLHTDRTYYGSGDTVHIHALIRENNVSLRIPSDVSYDLIVTNAGGNEVSRIPMKPNEFGTMSSDYILAKDIPFGNYSLSLSPINQSGYIAYGRTNFQVGTPHNSLFSTEVTLRSPDIEGESIKNLRKKKNTHRDSPWYTDQYEGKFSLEGIVKGKYRDGFLIRNAVFTYTIYRNNYMDPAYWKTCFSGCDHEVARQYITEGSGTIDQDGIGIFREPIEYMSYSDDYEYIADITLRDPLSGEEVSTSGSLVVKLPITYKSFSSDNPLLFIPKKKILQNGESIQGFFQPTYGTWNSSLVGKYGYEILHREYSDAPSEDIGVWTPYIPTTTDSIISSGSIGESPFSQKLIAFPAGEYILRIFPLFTSGGLIPDTARSQMSFFIAGNTVSNGTPIRVIPEKALYSPGETVRVFVTVPFSGSHILLTLEKGGVFEKEYFALSGTTFTREYTVDDTMLPNVYIGVVALAPGIASTHRSYAVGYGEFMVDSREKKGNLTLIPDKIHYTNNETVSLDITLSDRSGNPLQGEISLTVIDESLTGTTRALDLDILSRFYQKFPFTMKTSLTSIGVEGNRWLSRKGSDSGSGYYTPPENRVVDMLPGTLSQHTIYSHPSIRTDISGKAKTQFILPDVSGDYRIIAFANTKDSHFASSERILSVSKNYLIEASAPTLLRSGDISELSVRVSNHTKKIIGATLTAFIGTGSSRIQKSVDVTLNPDESLSRTFPLLSTSLWKDLVPYTIELRENNILLDSSTGSFQFVPISETDTTHREVILFTGTTLRYTLPKVGSGIESASSKVSIRIAPTYYTPEFENSLTSLMQNSHGSIEEVIGSTLSNLLILSSSDTLNISMDPQGAREKVQIGLTKILRMQQPSGDWTYWEGDSETERYITPSILRSLVTLRSFGASIPDAVFDNGVSSLLRNLSVYHENEDILADAIWTLALLKHTPEALELWKSIDTRKLHRHGYLAYSYAGQILSVVPPEIGGNLDVIMFSTGRDSLYRYFDELADQGIYAQFLFDRGEEQKASALLARIVSHTDLSSSFSSTQARMQIFLALVKQIRLAGKTITKNLPMAFRSDSLIADATLMPSKSSLRIETTRDKIGGGFTLKRDDTHIPIWVTVMIADRPRDIRNMPPENTLGMNIARTFELIDESKGIDSEGKYISATPVIAGIFHKRSLYRVTLKSFISSIGKDSGWHDLIIEDHFPGGWRPIIFASNGVNIFSHASLNSSWKKQEFRTDRVFACIDTGYGNTRTYTYYIRPNIIGKYLLPPATSSFIYHPDIHASTGYEKIQVRDSFTQ